MHGLLYTSDLFNWINPISRLTLNLCSQKLRYKKRKKYLINKCHNLDIRLRRPRT